MSNVDPLYPEPMQSVPAAERTPQQWVDFLLQIESAVLEGKETRFDDGRAVVMEDLAQIRKARAEWERRATQKAQPRRQNFGGFHYRTPDMTR